MFSVEEQPVHGQLRLDLSPDPEGMLSEGQGRTIGGEEKDRTFSMLDLWQGRVMYVHGGSEDQHDFFMLSVFSSNKKELPVFLKGNRLHRFDVNISPVNDAPVLSLPEGNLLTLLEKSKHQVGNADLQDHKYPLVELNVTLLYLQFSQLTTDVLRVWDPDSSPAELVFSSLGKLHTEAGYLEHLDYPGRLVLFFEVGWTKSLRKKTGLYLF